MKAIIRAIITIGLVAFIVWSIISGAGPLLILVGAYVYLFIMKHGR